MAKEVIIELKAKTDKIEKDVEGINKEIKSLNKNVDKTAEGFEGVEKATQDTAKGVRKIGTTLKAIGIGLLLAAFSKLKEVFEQNQKVADAFNIAFESLSIAFNDFFRFLENNIGTITGFFKDIFENPTESIKDFGQAILDNLVERFVSFNESLGLVASSLVKLFKGDFEGAIEDIKGAGKEMIDVVTGVDDSFDKAAEIIPKATNAIKGYVKSTTDAATETVKLNNQVQLAEALQQGLIEKYDLQAEQQRQIRDDESKTIEERIEANRKLGEILDKQEEEMLKNAQLKVDAAERELAKNKDNIALQVELINAENELAGVQAQVAGFRSEQLTNINSLERERQDLLKETAQNEKDLAEKSLADNKRIQEQKAANIKGALSNIASIVGANSKFGKAIAIVQALQDTYAGANKALAQGGIFGFIGAAAVISAGIANVKQIAGSKSPKPPASLGARDTGEVTPTIPTATTTSVPPQFNTVGASGTNQLAELLGGQKPPRAYVVSGDISTAQELDRNIVSSASLG